MPFPGNRIFPGKIREISRPKQSGRSSFRSCLSPAIRDWPIPVPSQSQKWNGNSRNLVLDRKFPVGYWNMLYKSRQVKKNYCLVLKYETIKLNRFTVGIWNLDMFGFWTVKRGWFVNGPDFKCRIWNWEAQPFKIWTNGHHFVKTIQNLD